jgi:hypothetical protein
LVFGPLACQPARNSYRQRLVVYTTLDPGLSLQTVVIDRTFSVAESVPDSLTGLGGALVKLRRINSGDSVVLSDSGQQGFYRDYHAPYHPWALPCSTYELSVARDSYVGSAIIHLPDTFSITRPVSGETISDLHVPPFSWRQSKGAGGYQLYSIDLTHRRRNGIYAPIVVSETTIVLGPLYQALFDSTGLYRIKVYATGKFQSRRENPAPDTIGPDVLGFIGSQSCDSTVVLYQRVRP